MDLGASKTVEMVHVMNNFWDETIPGLGWSETMGSCAMYVTDNDLATETNQYTKCSSDFYEGGFKSLSGCKGRYLILKRTGPGMSRNDFTIS